MNYLNLAIKDSAETGLTALFGALGSRLMYGQRFYLVDNFEMFPLTYLNGTDTIYTYAAVFGLANAIGNITGDFILPLLGNQQFGGFVRDVRKISGPSSIGAISVLLLYLLNGFSISMEGAGKAFMLGAMSNVAAQWISDRIPSSKNQLLNDFMPPQQIPIQKPVDIPVSLPQQPQILPFVDFKDFGGFNGFGGFGLF